MNLRITATHLLERLRGVFAPVLHSRWMWLEVIAITLCALVLGMFFQRDNPFQIGGEFPWIWLAPVLVALRYGVAPGIASSLFLLLAWLLIERVTSNQESFPEQFFLGGLVLVMLCGEFSAAWGSRLRRAEESSRYLHERLSRITLRHLLLRLSHDRMEQEVLTKPVTLRDALINLRKLTTRAAEEEELPAAPALLQMLTQYCQLESAAIHIPNGQGGYHQIAMIGSPPSLDAGDPLLRHALQHQTLSHLLTEGLADKEMPSPFLVIAPILTSDKQLLGVLSISSLPFLALNKENLQMLSVMLGYYADCLAEARGSSEFYQHFPDAPADFAAEFSRLFNLQRRFGINSHLVVLSFARDDLGQQAIRRLMLQRRGLDLVWQVEQAERTEIVNLMPLANEAAVQGYLLRVDKMMEEYVQLGFDETSMHPVQISLAEDDPIATLEHLLKGRPA